MTDRNGLRRLAEALPPGAAVTVPREWLLELLADPGEMAGPDLTVPELAALFRRSESTARTWLERGEFEGAYKLAGKSWRIPRAAVPAFRAKMAARPVESGAASVDLSEWRKRPPAA